MKREITLDEANGKVFTGFVSSESSHQAILLFGDEFCCLDVKFWNDPGDAAIVPGCLSPLDFTHDYLVEAGVASPEELTMAIMTQIEDHARRRETAQRQDYERLKRKFEPKEDCK